MPFQSEKQRRYLHANHPEIAKRWEKEYAHGGILDITGDEEITTDDGNDIELTDYNAAFDDPNDLSTGVRTLFMKKGGQAIGGGTIKGEARGDRTGFRNPHEETAAAGGWGPGAGSPGTTSTGGNVNTGSGDGGMGAKETYIQTQYTSPEAIAAKKRRELKDLVATGPGSPIEKYDTPKQHLADIPGTLEIGPQQNLYKTRVNANYTRKALEEAQRQQKEKLKKMGIQKLGGLGIMLVTFLAMGVPLGDALQYLPKTISLSKKDLGGLLSASIPVMKAKKAHIEALGLQKGALLKDVDINNPNEMANLDNTDFPNIMKELNELTKKSEGPEDTGGDAPVLPPQLGGPSTEEMATEYGQIDWLGRIRAHQQKYKDYLAKIEREKLAREDNPIVSGTEMDIIALGNKGGLANLFRVKNQ